MYYYIVMAFSSTKPNKNKNKVDRQAPGGRLGWRETE
jgi:hypothetical protein